MKDKAGKTVVSVFRMNDKWRTQAITYYKELTFLGELIPLDKFESDFDTQEEANLFAKEVDKDWQPS